MPTEVKEPNNGIVEVFLATDLQLSFSPLKVTPYGYGVLVIIILAVACQKPGGVLKKVLYGEASPKVQPLTLLYTIFSEKAPLSYTFYWKKAPLSYTFLRRLTNKSLKQEVFLSLFSRSA